MHGWTEKWVQKVWDWTNCFQMSFTIMLIIWCLEIISFLWWCFLEKMLWLEWMDSGQKVDGLFFYSWLNREISKKKSSCQSYSQTIKRRNNLFLPIHYQEFHFSLEEHLILYLGHILVFLSIVQTLSKFKLLVIGSIMKICKNG